MEAINELVNDLNLLKASGVIFILSIIYTVIKTAYDLFTKSDIEKCLSYRGKDRVLSGLFLFVFITLISIVSSLNELIEMYNKEGAFFAAIVVLTVSVLFFVLVIFFLFLIHLVFLWKKVYPRYEVKIYDGDDYWEIFKVTKDNSVILRNNGEFLLIKDIHDLVHKNIRQLNKIRKK